MLGPNGETFGSPAPTKRGEARGVPLLANSIPYERGVPCYLRVSEFTRNTIWQSFATRAVMHVIVIVLSVVGASALVLLAVAVILALLSCDKDHWPPC